MAEVLLGLIAEFDEKASGEMQAIYQALLDEGIVGRQTKEVPYHITLGLYPLEKEEELTQRVDEHCGKLDAFPVVYQHIGLFGLDVLFLGPDVSHALLDLYERFALLPDPCWVAHTTVLMDDPDVILRAIPIVAAHFTRIEAVVERVTLRRFPPSELLRACALK